MIADTLNLVNVDDYLKGELLSPIKHEYLGGAVYALADERNSHNIIAGNTLAFLHSRLRGSRCRPFNSGTKIRIRLTHQTRFYYPDVSVICRPNPQTDSFQDEPAALFEVLSHSTRRIDERHVSNHSFAWRLRPGGAGVSCRGGIPPDREWLCP